MTWGEHAKQCADAAERAQAAGDDVAMIVLLKRAAEATQLARLLEQTEEQS